jgi:hypothetical protein
MRRGAERGIPHSWFDESSKVAYFVSKISQSRFSIYGEHILEFS